MLDKAGTELKLPRTAEAQAAYDELKAKLDLILASNPDCPGDGNMDGVVNGEDLGNWARIANAWKESSVYDFVTGAFRDGKTDNLDEAVIQANLGKTCERTYGVY
jgi:hypothetical protein